MISCNTETIIYSSEYKIMEVKNLEIKIRKATYYVCNGTRKRCSWKEMNFEYNCLYCNIFEKWNRNSTCSQIILHNWMPKKLIQSEL